MISDGALSADPWKALDEWKAAVVTWAHPLHDEIVAKLDAADLCCDEAVRELLCDLRVAACAGNAIGTSRIVAECREMIERELAGRWLRAWSA
jgi:hypothetical protein